nr:Flp family type IVb pilin [uncultured Trichococcus sp.]
METMKRLFTEEEGQGLVEYALIIAIISLVIVTAGPKIAQAITTKFTAIGTSISTGK